MKITTHNLEEAHAQSLVTQSEAAWLLGVTHDFAIAGRGEDDALVAIAETLKPDGYLQQSDELLYRFDDLWMFYVSFCGETEYSARCMFKRMLRDFTATFSPETSRIMH